MADITALPTIPQLVEHLGTTSTFTATAAITQGQVVAISATGVSDAVVASVAESGGRPIGVAITSQATAGGKVAVAMLGSIVRVAIADDTTGADARADVYAIGATIFELLTGTPPFRARDVATLTSQINHEVPPTIVERRRQLGRGDEPLKGHDLALQAGAELGGVIVGVVEGQELAAQVDGTPGSLQGCLQRGEEAGLSGEEAGDELDRLRIAGCSHAGSFPGP